MSDEVERFRLQVVRALWRMAKIEEQLRVEAEERGDDDLEAIHEHGAMCLREAQDAIRSIPRV